MSVRVNALVAVAMLALMPVAAAAQTTGGPAPAGAIVAARTSSSSGQDKPAGSTFTAGWRDGFFIQNDTGSFRLQIGALLQADGRFALDDSPGLLTNTFAIRRVRPYLRGRVADRFEFYLNPDFAGGTLVLNDAYIDTRFSNAFRVRVGKAKAPFGHERLQSVANILFLERGSPTAVAPNRDVGVQVLGDVAGGTVGYQGGVMNGTPDGGNTDLDTNDGKDLIGRIFTRPFMRNAKSPLAGLGFALSGSWGKQSGAGALPTIRTVIVQQTFISYTGAVADGTRTRYSPFVNYYHKGFGGWFEYVRSEMPIRRGTVRADVEHQAWQIVGSYLLTGETASDGAVRPKNDFDFGGGHWGAWQIAARYHTLSVDDGAVRLGIVAPGSSREAKAWTLGLNWYMNAFIKNVVNFEHVTFDDDVESARRPENVVGFRMQLNF